MIFALIFCGLFLAYANGANDNFKGVATLYGCGLASYKKALFYSTCAAFLGSIASIFVAKGLIAAFSGKGLVPPPVVAMPSFALSVAGAAAITVMLATRFGFPISTTHALTGALVGAGLVASNTGVDFSKLGAAFFLPLIVSPILSMVLSFGFYPLIEKLSPTSSCLCVTEEIPAVSETVVAKSSFTIANQNLCNDQGATTIANFDSAKALNGLHYLSAGLVCFARSLNDTPKLAALLLMVPFLKVESMILLIAIAMAIGGLLHSKKIAETMSHKVTTMDNKQGFTANFITAVVVGFGSQLQLPVSTTHVSVGSLFGIGLKKKSANWVTIKHILIAWGVTLPVAALWGFILFKLITRIHS